MSQEPADSVESHHLPRWQRTSLVVATVLGLVVSVAANIMVASAELEEKLAGATFELLERGEAATPVGDACSKSMVLDITGDGYVLVVGLDPDRAVTMRHPSDKKTSIFLEPDKPVEVTLKPALQEGRHEWFAFYSGVPLTFQEVEGTLRSLDAELDLEYRRLDASCHVR